jgi:MFS transporter, PAT family, solute carrier family 33 (acetyl-CoA transportor), member 1
MNSKKITRNINFDGESLRGDYSNVALLVLLYTMQGVILGVGYAFPIILHNKGNSYEDQAIFSLAFYPATGELEK